MTPRGGDRPDGLPWPCGAHILGLSSGPGGETPDEVTLGPDCCTSCQGARREPLTPMLWLGKGRTVSCGIYKAFSSKRQMEFDPCLCSLAAEGKLSGFQDPRTPDAFFFLNQLM